MTGERTTIPALLASLLIVLVAGCAPTPGLRTAGDTTPDRPAAVRPAADHDAALVLGLVERHRRRAPDDRRRAVAEAVVAEARAAGMDPLLVAAIVVHESSFRTRAVSSAGAVGLMQLRPFVARDVAARAAVDWSGRETLYEPVDNVRLGIRYLDELLERFDGDPAIALAAYNAGPTRVSARIENGSFGGSRYADRVLTTYARLDATRQTRRLAERDGRGRS